MKLAYTTITFSLNTHFEHSLKTFFSFYANTTHIMPKFKMSKTIDISSLSNNYVRKLPFILSVGFTEDNFFT